MEKEKKVSGNRRLRERGAGFSPKGDMRKKGTALRPGTGPVP